MAKNNNIGDKAPEWCLVNQHGNEVCLRDFKGKWVVLYFYPKDNTPGCTREALGFTGYRKQFEALNTVVVGVSPDSTAKHCSFIKKHGLELILLSDTEKKVLDDYGAWDKKSLYGRTFLGVVRSTFLIDPKGVIRSRWMKVKVNGHAEEVLDKIRGLQG